MSVGATRAARRVCAIMVPVVGAVALWGAAPALATEAQWLKGGESLTKSEPIVFSGHITMGYQAPGQRVEEYCEDSGKGTVAPKGAGEVTSWTVTSCTNVEGCGTGSTIAALHLPWHTQLSFLESNALNTFTETGKDGAPLFSLKCTTESLPSRYECPVPPVIVTNGKTEVSETVKNETVLTNCTDVEGWRTWFGSNQNVRLEKAGSLTVS